MKHLGPAVPSLLSLTKSLISDSLNLTVLTKSSVLLFFCRKVKCDFVLQKLLTLLGQKRHVFANNKLENLTSR